MQQHFKRILWINFLQPGTILHKLEGHIGTEWGASNKIFMWFMQSVPGY